MNMYYGINLSLSPLPQICGTISGAVSRLVVCTGRLPGGVWLRPSCSPLQGFLPQIQEGMAAKDPQEVSNTSSNPFPLKSRASK